MTGSHGNHSGITRNDWESRESQRNHTKLLGVTGVTAESHEMTGSHGSYSGITRNDWESRESQRNHKK